MMWRAALLGACGLGLAACTPSAADQPEQWRAVEIEATPVELGADTVGRLRFRGGLALSSPNPVFGGVSDIEVLDDGRLIGISDNGDWFEARLTLDENGACTSDCTVDEKTRYEPGVERAFAKAVALVSGLPLSDAEKADAIRRLLR